MGGVGIFIVDWAATGSNNGIVKDVASEAQDRSLLIHA